MQEKIMVSALVEAPIDRVWVAYNYPDSVKLWNAPSPDWHTPRAENDLREGGSFNYRMEAKDGSAGFDFEGRYTAVVPNELVAYVMDDGREVDTVFTQEDGGVRVTTTFDPENENPAEMQRDGWQAILDNFKRFAEEAV